MPLQLKDAFERLDALEARLAAIETDAKEASRRVQNLSEEDVDNLKHARGSHADALAQIAARVERIELEQQEKQLKQSETEGSEMPT